MPTIIIEGVHRPWSSFEPTMADDIVFNITVIKEEINLDERDLNQLPWIQDIFPEIDNDEDKFITNGENRSPHHKEDWQNIPIKVEQDFSKEEVESKKKLRRIKKKEGPHKCKLCGNGFTQRGNLKVHQLTHKNERPYKCNLCEYGCSQKGNLKSHLMRIHSDIKCSSYISKVKMKPLQCNLCDYRCSQKQTLKKHIMTIHFHRDEKKYQCSICESQFNNGSALKLHIRVHTNEKPFQCNMCEYRCSQGGNLKSHIIRIHMQTMYDELKVIKIEKGGDKL